ncbi:cation channel sperm-associated protein subunit beta isoform X1 [Mauremys mutica]|uniref:cation channel sperm-associated protein subunit beta isoform X1 n=2 Tax=Mauremys mutica TaxID=74926 RepID=UPI001D15EEEF|nr:cation channel sperm-associated protein subunit beta isoform X1 [Mauremys mutica]
MDSLVLYIAVGAILKMPNLSSGITYNVEVKENSSFSCYTEPLDDASPKPKVIKLYLGSQNLKISCHLYNVNEEDTLENRKKLLLLYTSSGLAPTIQIFNSTYSGIFYFRMKLEENQSTWTIDIPRRNITYNTDIAPIEEWFVRFTMHHRLNMFATEGTLLDVFREPLLQWHLGKPINSTEIAALIPDVINITVSKCPCANDVAVIALICNDTVHGIYLGVTYSGFISRETQWFNMTNSLCSLLDDDCAGLSLVNIILTNNHLIILTTLGLFISQDLRYPTGRILNFTKPSFCGFERDDYFSANVWYNVQCLANAESYEVDYISLSFNKDKTLSQVSTCFYSNDPYIEWYSCLPHRIHGGKTLSRRVVAFLIDYQQNTGIGLITVQNKAMVSVYKITDHKLNRQTKFPVFWFPDPKFLPFGMFFHPGSHFLYVYGSQVCISGNIYGSEVWFSDDGGNTFMLLITLENEIIIKTNMCVYSHSVAFVTDKGNIFFTKAGLERYAKLTTSAHDVFNLYYDHLGSLNIISLNESISDSLEVHLLDVITLIQEDDIGFDGPLSPQYITEQQMVFFEHIPLNGKSRSVQKSRFYGLHKGKVLQYRPRGSATIVNVFHHEYPPQYLSSVIVDVLEKFPFGSEEKNSFIRNSLRILKVSDTTRVKLQLVSEYYNSSEQVVSSSLNEFKPSDIEKTVVIPGFSSFLIVEVLDSLNALADATMPERVQFNKSFASDMWFVYDFGTKNGRRWKIIVDTCRYWVRELDNLPLNAIKYLDLTQTFNFGFRVTPVNTAYPIFHMPLMKLVVGNPSIFKVKTNDYWDDTDSYIMEFSVTNNFYKQGKSSIAVILTKASLVCDVSTIVLTLKSGCSYSKSMHYISPVSISAQSWLHGDPKDPYGFKLLKQLPVNYRPPSKLGIAVPLTDNFYNADPSKPRMRDYFAGSKNSGAYKQCANKSTRAECNCNDNEKLSFFVAFSDCKEKALRMKYPVTRLPVHFRVDSENEYTPLVSPFFVTVTEVNHRTNWEVAGTNETPSMLKMRAYLADKLNITLYNPEALALNIYGSELFHFRVATIPGVSFCNLLDEFQIYVDDAPLAFPGQYLVSTVTAVLVGGIIFVIFMMQIYEINIWNKVKSKVRKKNKVSVSETSASVTSTSS